MTPEQILALLVLMADLRANVTDLQRENATLRAENATLKAATPPA